MAGSLGAQMRPNQETGIKADKSWRLCRVAKTGRKGASQKDEKTWVVWEQGAWRGEPGNAPSWQASFVLTGQLCGCDLRFLSGSAEGSQPCLFLEGEEPCV